MEDVQRELRFCAHCGGTIAADGVTCAACGRPFIPDAATSSGAPVDDRVTERSADDRLPPATPVGDAPSVPAAASRNWAAASHLGALAGALLGGLPAFLAPLIVWLLRRDEHDPFASEHARHALNFNLSVIIYSIAFAIAAVQLTIFTLGLALLIVVPIGVVAFVGYLIVTVRAALAASRGEPYRYPFTVTLVR